MSPISTLVSQSIEELFELKVEARGQNVTSPSFIGAQVKKHDHIYLFFISIFIHLYLELVAGKNHTFVINLGVSAMVEQPPTAILKNAWTHPF